MDNCSCSKSKGREREVCDICCKGPRGRKGQQGIRGPQGPQGNPGLAGIQGPTGLQGPTGSSIPSIIMYSSGIPELPLIGADTQWVIANGDSYRLTGESPGFIDIRRSQFTSPIPADGTFRNLIIRVDTFVNNLANPQSFTFEFYRSGLPGGNNELQPYEPTGYSATVNIPAGADGFVSFEAVNLGSLPVVTGNMYALQVNTVSISSVIFGNYLSFSASVLYE